ncbi:MAG: hypothetical protein WAU96_10875 [Anaerolineae bacterium]|nr:hypothetical protein [Thermoflexales bacterium]
MALSIGTHDISTLLASQRTTVAQAGIANVSSVLQSDLAAHNAIVADTVSEMAVSTTERVMPMGGGRGGEMVEVDEFGRAPTQKTTGQGFAGLPLRKFQYAIGWTEDFMKRASPQDLQIQQDAAKDAHLRMLVREFKRAIYLSTNYDWVDMFRDNMTLPVKRFANADGMALPSGPNGESYDGLTHTHYIGAASLTGAALKSLANNVIEHGYSANPQVVINKADETTVRALASTDFIAYPDPRVVYRSSDLPGKTLDLSRMDNRAIGVIPSVGAEVWVKPWAIANYALAWDAGSTSKPLAFRQDYVASTQGLYIAAQFSDHPLTAEWMQAYFGFGVVNRLNGAVLYFGGATYTDPTIV